MTALPATERALCRRLKEEFPGFCIRPKQGSPLCRVIDIALRVITAGQQDRFLTHYHTVLGNTLYVAPVWASMSEQDRVVLLRHERIHLLQKKRLSYPVMAFLYLVPWFPLGLAYGRARLEWEAYAETLRATAELKGHAAARSPQLRDHIVGRFSGPDYGWMWPFRRQVERWYDGVLDELSPPAGRG